ncbi:HDOD domain-containing protein [Azospira restricta]|uniref:HDOD domain-containing protein n=1 Tax=Azospira restricta TaxID=404405 RepID=A0A974SLU8_9RHOO|nr:HDOD domain-containing protein [Azospira restricta]QRJ62516.1 HDOD domain-containing protein [Azospira restricta]
MTTATQKALAALTPAAQSVHSENLTFATSADASLRVMKAVDNPDLNMDDLARIVTSEPLLSAKVVRMANSVALNPSGRAITDVKQAVMRVGLAPIRSLAMALTLDQLRHSQRMAACRQLANRMWERSVHVAALSYVVARRLTRLPADEAMLAGIVHDLGRFYLLGIAADEFPELLKDQRALIEAIDELEATVGSKVLEALSLPESTIAAVAGRGRFGGAMPPQSLSDILFLACWLAPSANPFEDADTREAARAQEGAALGLDRQTIAEFVSASGDEIYSIALALEA